VSTALATKELLWLACREKRCCHATRVIVTGRDVWRIASSLELAPWAFTRYAEATAGAPDGFRLEPGGAPYQVVLAKRGRVGEEGAPCLFLWKLADGHAQCGLGDGRPLSCQAYPALVVEGRLRAESSACSCRRWSVLDLDRNHELALAEAAAADLGEYCSLVAAWNAGLEGAAEARSYRDYCTYLMQAYAGGEAGR
jgi:Fe-S-cluster containining protein